MAAVKTAAKVKQEGIRLICFMVDNAVEVDIPTDADVLADTLLDNDEPEECNPDKNGVVKSYKLRYVSFGDPNNPHVVAARIDGKTLTAPISGQLMVTLSKKAIENAARRSK